MRGVSAGSAMLECWVQQAVLYLSLGQGSTSRCQRGDSAFIYQSSLICFAFSPDVNKQAPPTTRTTPPLPLRRPRRPSISSFLSLPSLFYFHHFKFLLCLVCCMVESFRVEIWINFRKRNNFELQTIITSLLNTACANAASEGDRG